MEGSERKNTKIEVMRFAVYGCRFNFFINLFWDKEVFYEIFGCLFKSDR